ncbi:NDR1/HIN1-like protein 13 [Typha angustifolia]|uniref:NDR1/HIN1-like protein 13 n=1 Tax=Typha angustifolia TaxID=59011 RepID=UPI003C2D7328
MGDRAYPSSSKPIPNPNNPPPPAVNGGGGRRYPLPPPRRRRRRSCCCICCLWVTFFFVLLVFLAAIAAGVIYMIFHPKLPTFTVTSLRLSALNLTATDLLTSRLDFNITSRNPNRKIAFVYGDIAVSAFADGVGIGEGSIPGFVHEAEDTTVIEGAISSSGKSLDSGEASTLRKRKRFPLEIVIDTKAGVKMGGFKSIRLGIRVSCSGFDAAVGNGTAVDSSKDAKCNGKLRVKIWKLTI